MLAKQIKNKEFLEDSIKRLKKEKPSADIQLLEKTIGALFLVENLVKNNLEFIFKGGTSLVLLLDKIKRFSVDVDIITEENPSKVKDVIKNIVGTQDLFIRVEENVRDNAVSKRMDIAHYKFFFNSVADNTEKYILLDVAYESNKYPRIIEKRIENSELNIKSDFCVKIPSIESILGDKLTVLAPRTTGISYNSEKELELMKQLYDVDKLFNEIENVKEVTESFINIANREIKYRKLGEVTYIDVLSDIEDFAKDIIFRENKDNIDKITTGIRKFTNFMLEKKFLIDREALVAASKVLYLVCLIMEGAEKIERYGSGDLENYEMPVAYKKRLKVIEKINKEAYYYIVKTMKKL